MMQLAADLKVANQLSAAPLLPKRASMAAESAAASSRYELLLPLQAVHCFRSSKLKVMSLKKEGAPSRQSRRSGRHLAIDQRFHTCSATAVVAAAASASAATERAAASIGSTFDELRSRNEVALIPFIVAGDPDLATTEEALLALVDSGADIIELGVPYSDPLADGPVIQAAAARALAAGCDLQNVLDLMERVSPKLSAPVVLFTYYNPIMKKGAENFIREAKRVGVAGLVVPDVPLEETGLLRDLTAKHGIDLVLLTTPTTPDSRMASIAEATQGFVYLVSLTGVTGERSQVEGRVQGLLESIKKATSKPVAVGFGISSPEHAKQVVSWGADGVIVGSAIVRLLAGASSPKEGLAAVQTLMRSLKQECVSK